MLRSLRRGAVTLGLGLLTLLGLVIAIGATVDLFRGHDDPSFAGQGRLHSPFFEEVRCNRSPEVCERIPSVKLDLPNDATEDVGQKPLYDLVRREGPVAVDVEWVKDLGSATRVRYEGRWYRAAYPADEETFWTVLAIPFGLALLGLAGLFFLGRLLGVDDEEPAAAPG